MLFAVLEFPGAAFMLGIRFAERFLRGTVGFIRSQLGSGQLLYPALRCFDSSIVTLYIAYLGTLCGELPGKRNINKFTCELGIDKFSDFN